MSKLVGTWDLVDSQNWDEYMKALGVGFVTRKAAGAIKPTVTISNDGSNWTLKMTSTLKSSETKFTVGVEFDEDTLDGRKSRTLITSEGADKLVQEQKDPKTNQVVTTVVREIVGDQLVQTLTAGDVVCKRIYKRTA